ncbi:MAG: alpha/beta fold hydrolase, partial [Myxococcota bacterium]
ESEAGTMRIWLGWILLAACGGPGGTAGPDSALGDGDGGLADGGLADGGLADGGLADGGRADVLPPIPCRVRLPSDAVEGEDVFCVDLITREVPGDETSPEIRVHAVVFDRDLEGTPVVILQGGPAYRGVAYVPTLTQEVRRLRFGERPVVYVEQRGVGASEPSLSCRVGETLDACAAQLRAMGVAPENFHVAHSADDIAGLVRGLGYDEVLLAGGSFGSRLGLEVLRRHSDLVRAAYLESLVPPNRDFLPVYVTANRDALEGLYDLCASDVSCNDRYPDLRNAAAAVYARAAADPIESDRYGAINVDLIAVTLVEALYHQDFAAGIPRWINALDEGETEVAEAFLDRVFSRPPQLSILAYQVVLCRDMAPLFDRAVFEDALSSAEDLRGGFALLASLYESCDALGLTPSPPAAREPVVSDVPTLLVNPVLDSRTPLEGAMAVAAGLSEARIVDIPTRVHTPGLGFQYVGDYLDECGASVLRGFLDDPDAPVDVSCATMTWE